MDKRFVPIQSKIKECYGFDIEEAKCYFSTRNYVFVLPDGKTVIRVSMRGESGDRSALLSEVLWVDALKNYSDSICSPVPSQDNNYFEEFMVDGINYRVTCFLQAKGQMLDPSKVDNWFYMLLGDTVGRIHKASKELQKQGFEFKRGHWHDLPHFTTDTVKDKLAPELLAKCQAIMDEVRNIPKNQDIYGMVHGDIGSNNYFVDINNIWVFDFDDCHYNYFMFDIATALSMWLLFGVSGPDTANRDFLYKSGMLDNFKRGYERHMKLTQKHWNNLELFIKLRFVFINIILAKITETGLGIDLESSKQMMATILMSDDILEGLDVVAQAAQQSMSVAFSNETSSTTVASTADHNAHGEDVVFKLVKKVSSNNVDEVEKQIFDKIENGCQSLTLDCEDLKYISSAGLRIFLLANKRLKGNFKLINVQDIIKEILSITGLDKLIK